MNQTATLPPPPETASKPVQPNASFDGALLMHALTEHQPGDYDRLEVCEWNLKAYLGLIEGLLTIGNMDVMREILLTRAAHLRTARTEISREMRAIAAAADAGAGYQEEIFHAQGAEQREEGVQP